MVDACLWGSVHTDAPGHSVVGAFGTLGYAFTNQIDQDKPVSLLPAFPHVHSSLADVIDRDNEYTTVA